MDGDAMLTFCREHGIRLMVDAAHPFAVQLHQTIAQVSESLHIPVVRYDRIYPPRNPDIEWIDDYSQVPTDIRTLLATTGVQSIGRLKWIEEQGVKVVYRILNRESSIALAHLQGATDNQLCFYPQTAEADAILMKESGESGGFSEKIAEAKEKGMRIIVIRRPELSFSHCVNGPYGLRRAVERMLPEFYPLHSGLTTGTCATAAAVAATMRLLKNEAPEEVPVTLPNGETISVAVGYGEGYAYCIKEAGDDPDVTNGIEVRVSLTPNPSPTGEGNVITIEGGEGIGRFTLPGFDYPPGEPAINRSPREMIEKNLMPLLMDSKLPSIGEGLGVSISVPQGADIARRTFNPRLGIEGGMKALYPTLPQQAFVEYGNYIGEALKMAHELGIMKVTLGVMLGKAVKLADGHLDTHSRKATMDKAFIHQLLHEANCDIDISNITLAREIWDLLTEDKRQAFASTVIRHCAEYCDPLLHEGELTILLIDDEGRIYK